MLPVGKDVRLQRKKGAAGIDEVDARQAILEGDLLRPHVLLDRDRVVGAAFHRRIVADDQDLATRHAADAGDDARAGGFVVVQLPGGERRKLEKWRPFVEQAIDALAHRELPLLAVTLQIARAATLTRLRHALTQLRHERRHLLVIRRVLGTIDADARLDALHQNENDSNAVVTSSLLDSLLPATCPLPPDSDMRG